MRLLYFEKAALARAMSVLKIQRRLAFPFACISFALLAVPLGARPRRGGRAAGFSDYAAAHLRLLLNVYNRSRVGAPGSGARLGRHLVGNVLTAAPTAADLRFSIPAGDTAERRAPRGCSRHGACEHFCERRNTGPVAAGCESFADQMPAQTGTRPLARPTRLRL